MEKIMKISIFSLIFSLFLISISKGEDIKINDIIENSKSLDGSIVKFEGEAIGEGMNRGEYTWININDGSNAIGLWIKKEEASKILTYGDYHHKGDILEVEGIVNGSCDEHDGDIDVHVKSILIKEKGYKIDKYIDRSKLYISIILIGITIVFSGLSYKKLKKI